MTSRGLGHSVVFGTLLGIAVSSPAATVGNDYYLVTIDPSRNGAYTVGTGDRHPVTLQEGGTSTVLFGGRNGSAASYAGVRSYTSRTDYFMGVERFLLTSDPDFECVAINSAAPPAMEVIRDGGRDVGLVARWEIHRGVDELLIEERLVARGGDFTSSVAEITLSVTNVGDAETRIGLRYVGALRSATPAGLRRRRLASSRRSRLSSPTSSSRRHSTNQPTARSS
jgi:hypothetical protein